ncbi:precorrin-3B synthase [Paraburkholderia sp.]|uniref:precorrin-3B synthase n=1 Tax=Paraburkholderia sp. TaxID=1926495 RepID=UPI00257E51CF|nr:precorrin-3B synthase [Paraburkholderia sp.]
MNHVTSTFVPAASPRPSVCPGLWRIVQARDGGLCRIRLPCGELRADQALAIADAAKRHTSGVIEVTNRANLQLRGVRIGEENALTGRLLDAGLGPQAPRGDRETNPIARDDIRNLMVSPLAGRDPHALFDVTTLASQILSLLQNDPRFTALSPKFALMLDGGERLAVLDHPHDIWLAAVRDREDVRFAFGLAGCPPVLRTSRHVTSGTVLPHHVPALVAALLHTFLDLAAPDHSRMRDVLAADGITAFMERAQTRVEFTLARDFNVDVWRRLPSDTSLRLGSHPQNSANLSYVGGQPALGRFDFKTLEALAQLAIDAGNATLRMTPWQGVIVPDVPDYKASHALKRLGSIGLVTDAADPLAHVIACTGSQGCVKGMADTKADALLLATRLPAGVDVHFSGCQRSCAAAHCAPWTLLAVAPARYDLFRRDGTPGFGASVARNLTIDQAADTLERLTRSSFDA